jgi:hypothetical protein
MKSVPDSATTSESGIVLQRGLVIPTYVEKVQDDKIINTGDRLHLSAANT